MQNAQHKTYAEQQSIKNMYRIDTFSEENSLNQKNAQSWVRYFHREIQKIVTNNGKIWGLLNK